MENPKKIYKYEHFNIQSIKNLKAQSIFFGSPLTFNDPYDCAITAGFKKLSEQEIEEIRNAYINKPDIPFEVRDEFVNSSTQILRDKFLEIANSTIHLEKQRFLQNNGVSCFSEKNDDLLMWSHYGDQYKGYCLGFSTEYEPFNKIRKVKYCSAMPKIDLVPVLLNNDCSQILELFYIKAESWQYEKEWRSIHQKAGTLFTYMEKALQDVYCGPDMDSESLEIICLILGGQNSHVNFWKGSRSENEFKVNFDLFSYTPFIKAKELGLI